MHRKEQDTRHLVLSVVSGTHTHTPPDGFRGPASPASPPAPAVTEPEPRGSAGCHTCATTMCLSPLLHRPCQHTPSPAPASGPQGQGTSRRQSTLGHCSGCCSVGGNGHLNRSIWSQNYLINITFKHMKRIYVQLLWEVPAVAQNISTVHLHED